MTTSPLSGPGIRLRAPEPSDIDFLLHLENDTAVWKVSNTLIPYSRYQIEEYVMNAQQDIFASRQLRLMIDLKEADSGTCTIGAVDLFDFDPVHLRAGVGILITEAHRGKGYARETLGILTGYAFGTLHLHQLYCNITPDNEPSIHLFENSGFRRCGVKQDWINDGDNWKEEWMYQLISHHEQKIRM